MARQRTQQQQVQPSPTFAWKEGSRFSVEAEVAGRELERIKQRSGGILKVDDVVAAAQSPSSPLHNEFEWEDDQAAEKYRLTQARRLINSLTVYVRVEDYVEPEPVMAYVHVGKREQGYESTANAMSDDDMRTSVLEEALKFMEAGRRRYRALTELAEVWGAVDRVRQQQQQRRPRRGRPRRVTATVDEGGEE